MLFAADPPAYLTRLAERADSAAPRVEYALGLPLRHAKLEAARFQLVARVRSAGYRLEYGVGKILLALGADISVRAEHIAFAQIVGASVVQEKRKIIKCEDVHSSAESPALCGKAVQILRRINAAYAERMLRIAHHLRLYAAEIVQNGGRIAFIRQMLPSQAAQLYLFKCHVSPAFPEYFSAVPAK